MTRFLDFDANRTEKPEEMLGETEDESEDDVLVEAESSSSSLSSTTRSRIEGNLWGIGGDDKDRCRSACSGRFINNSSGLLMLLAVAALGALVAFVFFWSILDLRLHLEGDKT